MLCFCSQEITALFQIILIDLVLAGDNAIVIGLAAAGLPSEQRTKAVLVGIAAATILRIAFAMVTTQLLQVVGLVLAGGILLLWVSWKMFRELRTSSSTKRDDIDVLDDVDINADGTIATYAQRRSFKQAAIQIIVADYRCLSTTSWQLQVPPGSILQFWSSGSDYPLLSWESLRTTLRACYTASDGSHTLVSS